MKATFIHAAALCLAIAGGSSHALGQATVLNAIPLPLPIHAVRDATGPCAREAAQAAVDLYFGYLDGYHRLYLRGCAQALPVLHADECTVLMPHSSEEAARAADMMTVVTKSLRECTSQLAANLSAGLNCPGAPETDLVQDFETASMRRESVRFVVRVSPGVAFDLPSQIEGLDLSEQERAAISPALAAHRARIHQLLRVVHQRSMAAHASVARYLEALGYVTRQNGWLGRPDRSPSRPDVESAWQSVSRRLLQAAAAVEEENWNASFRVVALLDLPNQLRLRMVAMPLLLEEVADGAMERRFLQDIEGGGSGQVAELAREFMTKKQPLMDVAAATLRSIRSAHSVIYDQPEIAHSIVGQCAEVRQNLEALDTEFDAKLSAVRDNGVAPGQAHRPRPGVVGALVNHRTPESSELTWATKYVVSGQMRVPPPVGLAQRPGTAGGNRKACEDYLASYESSRARWSQVLADSWRSVSAYESCDPSTILMDTPLPDFSRACKAERQTLELVWAADLEWLQARTATAAGDLPSDLATMSARFEFLGSRCNPLGSDPLDSFGTAWRADLGAIAFQELGGTADALAFSRRFYDQALPLLEERQRALFARREAELAQRLGVQYGRALMLRPKECSIPAIGGKMLQDCKDQRATLAARHQALRQAHLRLLRTEDSLLLELKALAGPRSGRVTDRHSGSGRSVAEDQAVSKAISIVERHRTSDQSATQRLDELLAKFIAHDSDLADQARRCDIKRMTLPGWEECADDFDMRLVIEVADLERAVELDWIHFEREQRLVALDWLTQSIAEGSH